MNARIFFNDGSAVIVGATKAVYLLSTPHGICRTELKAVSDMSDLMRWVDVGNGQQMEQRKEMVLAIARAMGGV